MNPLTAEQQEKLRGSLQKAASVAKALRKLKENKTLSADEETLIADASDNRVKYFDTIAAAAGALNVAQSLLKRMKRDGCSSFRHGRVYIDEEFTKTLKAYLAAQGGKVDSKEKLEIRRLLAQCERIEFQLAVDRREFISSEEVSTAIRNLAEAQKAALLACEDEMPPKLAGLSAPAIKVQLRILTDTFCLKMRELAMSFGAHVNEPSPKNKSVDVDSRQDIMVLPGAAS